MRERDKMMEGVCNLNLMIKTLVGLVMVPVTGAGKGQPASGSAVFMERAVKAKPSLILNSFSRRLMRDKWVKTL